MTADTENEYRSEDVALYNELHLAVMNDLKYHLSKHTGLAKDDPFVTRCVNASLNEAALCAAQLMTEESYEMRVNEEVSYLDAYAREVANLYHARKGGNILESFSQDELHKISKDAYSFSQTFMEKVRNGEQEPIPLSPTLAEGELSQTAAIFPNATIDTTDARLTKVIYNYTRAK